jgi:hypothetical protein
MTKAEAESLLDWLEANGQAGWDVDIRPDGFIVTCPE